MGNKKQLAIRMGSKSCDEWLEQHPDSNCKGCPSEKGCAALSGSMIDMAGGLISELRLMVEDAQAVE